ncbi:MAG: S-layer homology domain-containing protein, partial [Oscillospiraceae bacterium]|nr:S-layer homology domain-containing protein [Oscillospiraceae bacterium]
LSDLKLTFYKKCSFLHCMNSGKVTKAPTCGAAGVKTYTCTICGKTQTESIAATGKHTWSTQGTYAPKPSCTAGGYMEYRCTVCSATKKEVVPALGHSWNQGVTSVAPSCTSNGTKLFTCTRCNTTRTEQISALGHIWSLTERLTEPTEENVHGTALYTCTRCKGAKQAALCAGEVFTDMPADDNWAHASIDWAWLEGVTNGTSETSFSPEEFCTRAQVVTFLWKAAGRPEPASTETAFKDLDTSGFYYKAVLWAAEQGITNGTSTTSFSPEDLCTRAQVVTFLWNQQGKPQPKTEECPFTDVLQGEYYTKAVLWANENNITNGTSLTLFSTTDTCTRAQFVTFLYRLSKISVPEEPTPEEPAPEEPAPEEPTPEEPAPEQPTPEQPAPEQPVPEQPVPEQPAP